MTNAAQLAQPLIQTPAQLAQPLIQTPAQLAQSLIQTRDKLAEDAIGGALNKFVSQQSIVAPSKIGA